MRTTVVVCAVLAWCGAIGVLADPVNVIHQRNPNLVEPTNYQILQGPQSVLIVQGVEGELFQFDALLEENGQPVGVGSIGGGIVALEDAGPVTVRVVPYDPFWGDGAFEIGKIDLGADGVTGVLEDVVCEQLGTTGDVVAGRAVGWVQIFSGMYGELDIGWLDGANIVVGEPTVQNIRIGCRPGGSTSHTGTVQVYPKYDKTLDICGAIAGTIELNDGLATDGIVHAHSDAAFIEVWGRFIESGPLDGTVIVDGNLGHMGVGWGYIEVPPEDRPAATGSVHIFGDLVGTVPSQFYCPMAGTIQLDEKAGLGGWTINLWSMETSASVLFPQTMSGNLVIERDMGGNILADTLSGKIRINGSLLDNPAKAYEVEIGSMTATAAVAVNADGYGWDQDIWEPGAVVKVGETEYTWEHTGSNPTERVWVPTCYVGDMLSDGTSFQNAVNNQDIDAFVLGLFNPSGYAAAHPGLGSSRIFHGDTNCDNAFNNQDIDSFVLRLFDPAGYHAAFPDCGCWTEGDFGGGSSAQQTGGDDTGSGYTPEDVAAVLNQSVSGDLMPDLLGAVAELAAQDNEQGEFWTAVLAALD